MRNVECGVRNQGIDLYSAFRTLHSTLGPLATAQKSCVWVHLGGIRLFLPDNSVSMFFHKK